MASAKSPTCIQNDSHNNPNMVMIRGFCRKHGCLPRSGGLGERSPIPLANKMIRRTLPYCIHGTFYMAVRSWQLCRECIALLHLNSILNKKTATSTQQVRIGAASKSRTQNLTCVEGSQRTHPPLPQHLPASGSFVCAWRLNWHSGHEKFSTPDHEAPQS